MLGAFDIDVREISPGEVKEMYPHLNTSDVVGAVHLPLDRVQHLKSGGAVLATGTSGLSVDARKLLLPELGVKPAGLSPFTTTYFRFAREISRDVPPTDHVMYERGVRVTASRGTRKLARIVEPYFERAWDHFSSHFQTPSFTKTLSSHSQWRGQVHSRLISCGSMAPIKHAGMLRKPFASRRRRSS
jgi:hypothetical protein